VLDLQLLNPLTDRLHACAIGAATISGPLSVGVIPTVAPYLLPPILAGFTRKYPLARVSVVEEITRK
jgi:LysR family hydrogen peroxide-inducible transcriptional activator